MGGIRRQRKKIVTPGHPYDKARLDRELPLVGEYGLRNKKELWKARTILSTARQQARSLLALDLDVRNQRESELLSRLSRFGILSKGSDLDSVLAIDIRTILDRRLQTLVHRKGLASTPYQARQFITHRHIAIGDGVVTTPSRLITVNEEAKIAYAPRSSLNDVNHPSRPQAPPVVEQVKPKEDKPKPEVKEDKPKPEVEEDKPKPEVKEDKPKPEVKEDKLKPEVKEDKPKPTPKPQEEKVPSKRPDFDLSEIKGVGAKTAMLLKENGFDSVDKIASASIEDLSKIPGIGPTTAETINKEAKNAMSQIKKKESK
jgi:small subunit ribosomal protein S4